MKLELERRESTFVYPAHDFDRIQVAYVECPCGKEIPFLVNKGPWFPMTAKINVWHYELSVDGTRISITPSLGFNALEGHTEACHLMITDQPFTWRD